VKKGSSGKNVDIILFAYSRGARKSLFCCSGVMAVCLHHVEISYTIDFSSQTVSLYMVKECDAPSNIDAPIHGKHDGTSYKSM